MLNAYEMVIGVEVHVELKTKSKIFCSCPTDFGAKPNTQCCPVCIGMPGSLPVLNNKVVEYAIKAGLATNCQIAPYSKNDRKNYFYPDLPKAYQISQFDLPLCEKGYLEIENENGSKKIGITRIHIEEDAGKLVHDTAEGTLIDLNRCGVPLIEIVSEPDLRSEEEVLSYLKKLRAVILYTGISDCKMNEGSFRCDINLSVRKKGEDVFGTRTEMKNLNSFQFISKAILYEYKRQVEAIEKGESIIQETRRFDSQSGKTFSMRSKENANDYRYFPDPDLLPIVTSDEKRENIRKSIPQLPDARKIFYMKEYGLSSYHSERLVVDKSISDYFEKTAALTQFPKQLANLILSDIAQLIGTDTDEIRMQPEKLATVVNMVGTERISNRCAKTLIAHICKHDGDPNALIVELDLVQINDEKTLKPIVSSVLKDNEKLITDYQNGKTRALKALMGKAMAKTNGKGNPSILSKLVMEGVNIKKT